MSSVDSGGADDGTSPYDPRDPKVNADPFPSFRRLQKDDPIHKSEIVGGWVVTRFKDVQVGLKDSRLSSDRITPAMLALPPAQQEQMKELWSSLTSWTVFADPPAHARLRGLFNKAFTRNAVERLRTNIEQLVSELLSEPLRRGHMEFIDEFAYPMPARVICDLIGIPISDIGDIQVWSDDIATFIGLPKKPWDSYVAADRSNHALVEYFRGLVAERRKQPREDLLSNLISVTENGSRLSEHELIATCILLLFAAHTTTTHLLGNGLVALAKHPEQFALMRSDPSCIDSAVEELLRYDGPVQAVRRLALQPIELGGKSIAPGELVFFMINAANRDPDRFLAPDVLDIRRRDNHHIAFGSGFHVCPGAALARIEAREAFRALASRTKSVHLETEDFDWLQSFGFRGLRKLPIELQV